DVSVRLPQEGFAFLLRNASGDRHNRLPAGFLLENTKLAETRIELLLSVFPHTASVDDDHVGVDGFAGWFVTSLVEQTRHPLGVVEVHLTAERLDEVFLRHFLSYSRTFAFSFRLSPSLSGASERTRPTL